MSLVDYRLEKYADLESREGDGVDLHDGGCHQLVELVLAWEDRPSAQHSSRLCK